MPKSTVARTAARKKKRQPAGPWEFARVFRIAVSRPHPDCGGGRWVNRPRRDFYDNGVGS